MSEARPNRGQYLNKRDWLLAMAEFYEDQATDSTMDGAAVYSLRQIAESYRMEASEEKETKDMPATRLQVFAVLNQERRYQENKWGDAAGGSVAAYLTFIRHHLRRAEEIASTSHNQADALDQVRKIAALGVACMEQHGAPERKA